MKIPYLAIFRLELEKTIVMLNFTTFNFLKLGINLSYLAISGLEFEKSTYSDILHQHPQIFPNTKFRPKTKILKFGTEIVLIGYFGLEF